MMTFREAVMEALHLQAEIGAAVIDIECSSPNAHTMLCYLLFGHEWHVIGFAAPRAFSREQCEKAFIAALAYEADGATVH